MTLLSGSTTYTGAPDEIIDKAFKGEDGKTKLAEGETIQLGGDITGLTKNLKFNSGISLTLDLNEHSITSSSGDAILVGDTDTSGENSTIFHDCFPKVKKGNNLTIIGNGTITGKDNGIYLIGPEYNNPDLDSSEYSKLTVGTKGGTDEINITGTEKRGIAGNGSAGYFNIEINTTGTIEGTKAGIYNSQVGKCTINSGTIKGKDTSTGSGVEIRAGELEVNGGTIIAGNSASSLDFQANSNGTTTSGAGIAIAQHDTLKKITVTINGGNISGYAALAATNPNGASKFYKEITALHSNSTAHFGELSLDEDGNKQQYQYKEQNLYIAVDEDGNPITKSHTRNSDNKNYNVVLYIAGDESNYKYYYKNLNNSTLTEVDKNEAENTLGASFDKKVAVYKREIGNITVNVKDATLTSTSTATEHKITSAKVKDGNGTNVDGYKMIGKDAILNGDSRVNISISDTTIDGNIASTPRTVNEETGVVEAYTLQDNKYTIFEDGVTFNELFNVNTVSESGGFTVVEYAAKGWNLITTNSFVYYSTKDAEAAVASLAPVTTITGTETVSSTTDLVLTTKDTQSEPTVIVTDLTKTQFTNTNKLAASFKTLDASGVTDSNVLLNITANKNFTSILGGKGNDTLTAGAAGTSLNGGEGNDYLIGGDKNDTFIYTAGKDSIEGYTSSDVVSLGAGTAPIDFSKLSYNGNDFIVSLGTAEQVLTFKNTAEFTIDGKTYKGGADGVEHIAQGTSISLGAGFTKNVYDGSETDYTTIDAHEVTVADGIAIKGSDTASSLFGAANGGEIKGGAGGDSLKATGGNTTLNGDYGDDLLIGVDGGKDTFIYNAGADSIQGYTPTDGDIVVLEDFKAADATFSVGTTGTGAEAKTNISLDFGAGDKLIFENVGTNAISVQSGKDIYTYTKDYVAVNDTSVTLAANYDNHTGEVANNYDASGTPYTTIDASAVSPAVSVMGNTLDNKIFGSKVGGSLYGGAGDDLLDVTERNSGSKFTFKYTAGKDTVDGFDESNDQLEIDSTNNITGAKTSNGRLVFNFSNKSNVLTFKGGNDVEAVSLNSGGFLTKDGVVTKDNDVNSLELFANTKGRIDLTDTPYKGTDITSVNAAKANKQSVTLVGGAGGGVFTFANNKKKDLFDYSGGDVTISGYEASKDRINLENYSIKSFAIGNTNDVVLTLSNEKTMSIAGAVGHEVLIRDASGKSNSYAKMVFAANGVLHNKDKRPTAATVSTGASNYDASNSIKKIYVTDGVSGISVSAGNNKTVIDASEAGGVTLSGGNKNDKLIGNTAKADTFFYSAGKDVIEGYDSSDQISLTGGDFDLEKAKITVSKSALKIKFSSKNTLTLKNSDLSKVKIDGEEYTFSKNAIAKGDVVTLTSEFSGTYKLDGINTVDGGDVRKNLTYKGTSAAESLVGGTKKTTFKGGGGKDTLVGGTGKDIFFYAKGDAGTSEIQSFELGTDKLKIANGTIKEIATVSGGIQFDMTSGKKGDTATTGSFKLTSSTGGVIDTSKTLIKANNTYYWFAKEADSDYSVKVGDLITASTKVTKAQANSTGYGIIDLGYSTNLAKSTVAIKAGEYTFTSSGISKKTT